METLEFTSEEIGCLVYLFDVALAALAGSDPKPSTDREEARKRYEDLANMKDQVFEREGNPLMSLVDKINHIHDQMIVEDFLNEKT